MRGFRHSNPRIAPGPTGELKWEGEEGWEANYTAAGEERLTSCNSKEACLEGGIFLTILYVFYFSLFHFFFFFLNQGEFPSPGKGGPGLTVPVSEQDDTRSDFLLREPTMPQPSSHKENIVLPLVEAYYHWSLFQNHGNFPDLVPFSGQKVYKEHQSVWDTSKHTCVGAPGLPG